jgi:uncharacterized membrane protein
MSIRQILHSVESVKALDRPAAVAAGLTRPLAADTLITRLLRGSWLGHPVHPLLVTLPLGAWMSSLVFDLAVRDRDAARRLLALGLLATPPTVLAGLADYPVLTHHQRRVGVAHAAANVVAAGLFAMSYRSRRRGHERKAVVYSVFGLVVVAAGGALGGHLSYAQGAGVFRWQPVRATAHLKLAEHRRAA